MFEGVDRCGKTTQATMLAQSLKALGHATEFMRFPDRETAIGRMINAYLTNTADLDDHAIHLLFSANRWEKSAAITKLLHEGVTVVVDRYAYSGVAFSGAKDGMELEWCKKSDVGLPAPDAVFYLTLAPEVAARRAGFGGERYEVPAMQARVRHNYDLLKDPTWQVIDADATIESLQAALVEKATAVVEAAGAAPLGKLWV